MTLILAGPSGKKKRDRKIDCVCVHNNLSLLAQFDGISGTLTCALGRRSNGVRTGDGDSLLFKKKFIRLGNVKRRIILVVTRSLPC